MRSIRCAKNWNSNKIKIQQEGNSNLDCIPPARNLPKGGGSLVPTLSTRCVTRGGRGGRGGKGGRGGSLVPTLSTRCVTRGGGGGGVLSSNFVHQMCHEGGGGGGRGGRGVLSSNFVHQMCQEGGGEEGGGGRGRVQRQILSKILAGYISLIECVIAFKFSQCVGHTKDSLYAES